MPERATAPNLFTIPAGVGFADAIAAELLQQNQESPEKLTETLILLPTRRGCRIVRDAFLRRSGGVALLLPRLQTLGDIDEDALGLEIAALTGGADILDLPPALPPLKRRILLTRLILARQDERHSPDQALLLADALGTLLDRIYTEGLDIAALPNLVDRSKFAGHWQVTLDFLTIISQVWPGILAEMGYIDATDRRNRLLEALAAHWTAHPPAHPVIAAGSTGSIPATGNLLRVIATMPGGTVILPALDQDMDEKSWRALDDTHPQATLRNLLDRMKTGRDTVKPWIPGTSPRQILATEMMRPAATTETWRDLGKNAAPIAAALKDLQRIDCPTAQAEARLISLIFRYIQHQPGQTAALVTFDRNLARRVIACCARWGLNIDDSGGQPLTSTALGGYLELCAQACSENLAPVSLLALLKHRYAGAGLPPGEYRQAVRRLDREALRGPRPGDGIAGLKARAPDLLPLIGIVETALSPLLSLCDGELHPFTDFLRAHVQTAETLAGGPDRIWADEAGEGAALFFSDLLSHAGSLPDIRHGDYLPILQTLMRTVNIRRPWGIHPRLSILGPLEARLLSADLVILGGLNEGIWPPAPENDPWMSRPMRKTFGLPPLERGIGLSAHDFIQGFNAKTVILTRSERTGTAPTIPSRWLQRLDTVLKAANLSLPVTDWLDKSRELDHTQDIHPISRPQPRPPAEKRPRQLSVTDIETWMRDPYALYARHVLSLKLLDPIDQLADAADQGTIIHAALERFVKTFPDRMPEAAMDQLRQIGHNLIDQSVTDARTKHFWTIRFDRLSDWFIRQEETWRTQATSISAEIKGRMDFANPTFTLVAKADRIDILKNGDGVAIIDYKTGAIPSKADIRQGASPQLPLEAAMIMAGAFPDIGQRKVGYLGFWGLSGPAGGKEETVDGDLAALAGEAVEGLKTLAEAFTNPETPYLSQPRPAFRPRYSDYTHLARVQEWAVLDEGEENAA